MWICSCLRIISGFLVQSGFLRPSAGFSRLSNQQVTWIGIREKMVDWGEKMKTRISKISLGSRAKKLPLRGGEESQVFTEVKHSKYQNGFFTTSSLDLKLSRTIFSFPIRWAKTKIFEFEDFGLEVERSQSVDPKISKLILSNLFLFPPRTHSD